MDMETIDSRMSSLTKKHRGLEKTNISIIWNELIRVIDQYLSGCQADAFETFYALFIKNVESLRLETIQKDSFFYRMRVGKNGYEEFTSNEEMSHIPFQFNHKVGNERYSMSGFPSLYLGSSVYVCWEEMRRPDIDYANFALFKTTTPVKVVDLSNKEHYHFTGEKFADCLVLACSIPVQFPDDPFKPEYIIPQMLLQSLVRYNRNKKNKEKIMGIKYSSTHINDSKLWINYPENRINRKLFYNYVFPAFDRKEKGLSSELNTIFQFWNSITYNKLKLMNPDLQSDKSDIYGCSVFGKIEYKLQIMNPSGMLSYDPSNPVGLLT